MRAEAMDAPFLELRSIGKTYPGTHKLIETARRVVGDAPILVGGGVTANNIHEVQVVADGVIVSSSLMSMGMMMLPPVLVSLPFKLLLFVMVDGWALVVRSLLASFKT